MSLQIYSLTVQLCLLEVPSSNLAGASRFFPLKQQKKNNSQLQMSRCLPKLEGANCVLILVALPM